MAKQMERIEKLSKRGNQTASDHLSDEINDNFRAQFGEPLKREGSTPEIEIREVVEELEEDPQINNSGSSTGKESARDTRRQERQQQREEKYMAKQTERIEKLSERGNKKVSDHLSDEESDEINDNFRAQFGEPLKRDGSTPEIEIREVVEELDEDPQINNSSSSTGNSSSGSKPAPQVTVTPAE